MNEAGLQMIRKIREAEAAAQEGVLKDPWRLRFHLMPPAGWLNDPNGLCQMNGVYHVFFQYSPFDPCGGEKFWGHYTSRNLTDWNMRQFPWPRMSSLTEAAFIRKLSYKGWDHVPVLHRKCEASGRL